MKMRPISYFNHNRTFGILFSSKFGSTFVARLGKFKEVKANAMSHSASIMRSL